MKRRFVNNIIILMSLLLCLGSCSKYDDGPNISLYIKEKRLQGRWYFSTVMYNDVDSTDTYRYDPMQSIEFFYNPDKDVVWNAYTWSKTSVTTGSIGYGQWQLNEEKDSIRMVTTMLVYGENLSRADTVEYSWKIKRLAYTEFWVERQADDTTLVSWRLWKRAY